MNCDACELCTQVQHPCIMGKGKKSAKIMIIQDSPSIDLDDVKGKPFSGKSCIAFNTALENRDIPLDKVYFTSLVKCATETPAPAQISACKYLIEAELEAIDPDIVVPMGNASLKFCVGRVGITKSRGNAQEVELVGHTRIILPVLHPITIRRKPANKDFILKDLDTLKELYQNGMTQVTNVDYRYLETVPDIQAELQRMKQEAKWLVFDIETTGKSPYMPWSKVICISLTDKTHYGVVIPLYKQDNPMSEGEIAQTVALLKDLMEDPTIPKCAHNGKFDVEWLAQVLDIHTANFSFDTMLAHYLAISEEQGTQGLKSQAWEFTDMGGYDNELDEYRDKLSDGEGVASRFNYDRIPWEILRTYAAADVDCCFRLLEIYKPKIDENPMWKIVMNDIMMPGSYALGDVEANGMKLDASLAQKYKAVYAAEVRRIQERLETFPEVLTIERERQALYKEREAIAKIPKKDRTPEEQKKMDEYGKYKDFKFNWGSVAQLRDLLYNRLNLRTTVTTEKGDFSTGEEALKEIQNQGSDVPRLLLELRKITTLNNMFIQKLPSLADSNGIIHSSFNMSGTVTGRLSSENPNFQQIPRKSEDPLLFQYHNEPKALFTSRFGDNGCILNADYCLAPDTVIQLINGEQDNIKSICDRVTNGEQVYTYSINPQTEEIEVSRIVAGRMTRVNEPTLKVTLDNGKSVICSHNHKFLLRGGEYKEAQDLLEFEKIMGFAATPGVHTSTVLVTNVEPYENMDLYDIEVEYFENFALVNGCWVHNSALEMRVAGIISNDEKMAQAFLSGADIHKANASYVFKVPIEEVSKDQRTYAKTVGFGVIYGKSGATFGKDLYFDSSGKDPNKTSDWTKAKKLGFQLVDHFLGTFTGLRDWLEATKKKAHKLGYVETMFGRRRRLPDLNSKVQTLRNNAERQAINAPIQGTGSDFTMLSVIQINQWLKDNNMKSLMIATVHDSIVFDVYIPELHILAPKVKEIMESVHKPYIDTIIPIRADLELGRNYGATFEVELAETVKLTTTSDFVEWNHQQYMQKYQKEITTLHKQGYDYMQLLKFMKDHQRPAKQLVEFIVKTYDERK